jgi:hypothetical protein
MSMLQAGKAQLWLLKIDYCHNDYSIMTTVKNDYGNREYVNIDYYQFWLPLIMTTYFMYVTNSAVIITKDWELSINGLNKWNPSKGVQNYQIWVEMSSFIINPGNPLYVHLLLKLRLYIYIDEHEPKVCISVQFLMF